MKKYRIYDRIGLAAVILGLFFIQRINAEQQLDVMINRELPSLVETYKMLHAAPELPHYEEKTSEFVARQLRSLGFVVTEGIGKYSNPRWKGHGVVAVLKNGVGPTVLLRTDLDALPVKEKTKLAYASTVKTKDDMGQDVDVMHACGHDLHITSFLGTAKLLANVKDLWHGTLMMVGQPSEETVDGAKAMLDDGLYNRFGKPDYLLALHVNADLEAGQVGYTPGFFLASINTVTITIRGVGGHGSRPEATKDPIVIAAQVVLALQTIVSRENSPLDPAVVSVGSIHGGTKANIIPDEVRLQLTVRAYKEEVRQKILASIERITKGVASAAGVPSDRMPVVEVSPTECAPATCNDPKLTTRLANVFKKTLGARSVVLWPSIMGSEDFGRYSLEGNQIPGFMFWIGATDPVVLDENKRRGVPPPGLHSGLFAPLPEPAIKTGIRAMTAAVLDLMAKQH
ncbi:MAG: amidohydrolase [Kiritimatiellae bacterium]|nr:amidohydrolase [Kiritimatiellia bacterium]MDD5522030.1 amidohydrolase [Kiritimatiellia bacterium]